MRANWTNSIVVVWKSLDYNVTVIRGVQFEYIKCDAFYLIMIVINFTCNTSQCEKNPVQNHLQIFLETCYTKITNQNGKSTAYKVI